MPPEYWSQEPQFYCGILVHTNTVKLGAGQLHMQQEVELTGRVQIHMNAN